MMVNSCPFTDIILTAPNESIGVSYHYQLERIKLKLHDYFVRTSFFCCSDPNGERIGSGGGTLHALKEFSDSKGSYLWEEKKILLIHSGGDSRRAPFYSVIGKAFMSLNGTVKDVSKDKTSPEGGEKDNEEEEIIATPLILLIQELSRYFRSIPKESLVITCSDVLLKLHDGPVNFPTNDITIVTMPAVVTTAVNHGVLHNKELIEKLQRKNDPPSSAPSSPKLLAIRPNLPKVDKYLQKPKLQTLLEEGMTFKREDENFYALIDSGIVVFSGSAFQALLRVRDDPIFESKFLRFELYSELLLACGGPFDRSGDSNKFYDYARQFIKDFGNTRSSYETVLQLLWKEFSNYSLNLLLIENGKFSHLGTSKELLQLLASSSHKVDCLDTTDSNYYKGEQFIHSSHFIFDENQRNESIYSVSSHSSSIPLLQSLDPPQQIRFFEYSLLSGEKTALMNSDRLNWLSSSITSHLPSFISSNLNSSFPGMMLQCVPIIPASEGISDPVYVLSILSIEDNAKLFVNDIEATIGGVRWEAFLSGFSLKIDDIWREEDQEKSLWTAKLFPITRMKSVIYEQSSAPVFFLIDALHTLHSNNWKDHSLLLTKAEHWKQSERISLADIMKVNDHTAMMSWQLLLETAHQLTLFSLEGEDEKGNKASLFEFIDHVYHAWRSFNLSINHLHPPKSKVGYETFPLEISAVALLQLLGYQHFFPLQELLKNPHSEQAKEIFSFLSSLFFPSSTSSHIAPSLNNAEVFVIINAAIPLIQSIYSFPYDYSSKLHLITLFLQNLIIQDHYRFTAAFSFVQLGKLLPSHEQPRLILLIANIVKNLSKFCESKIDYYSLKPQSREVLMDLVSVGLSVPSTFEGKLQLLYRHILIFPFERLKEIFANNQFLQRTSSFDDSFNIRRGKTVSKGSLSMFIEGLAQKLIEYHLSLSIIEKLSRLVPKNRIFDASTTLPGGDVVKRGTDFQRRVSYATSPVRIDLMGGWSDTPPICYDQGGKVLNVAVKVNHKNPVRCVSRYLPNDPKIVLRCYQRKDYQENGESLTNSFRSSSTTNGLILFGYEEITEWRSLRDVHHSSSPCALLKACLIALGWEEPRQGDSPQIRRPPSLSDHIQYRFQGGIEISCLSDLPAGSGMGGSSILAATILASLCSLFELKVSHELLMDYVSYTEQILTTGGGWQDQIGGCFGGFKLTSSTMKLPLELEIHSHIISNPLFLQRFEDRACLIYSGKQVRLQRHILYNLRHRSFRQRLAKNTLINALRSYSVTCNSHHKENKNNNKKKISEQRKENYVESVVDQLINDAEEAEMRLKELINKMNQMTHNKRRHGDGDGDRQLMDMIDDIIDYIGTAMNRYWHLKIQMAKGSNPPLIAQVLCELKPLTVGLELAGAGGGGFIVALLARTSSKASIEERIAEMNRKEEIRVSLGELKLYDVSIDNVGLTVEEKKVSGMSVEDMINILIS